MSDSPFLPGTKIQFAWDSTSLGWLKACPRQYQYAMVEGWRAKGDAVNLTFGIFYHGALEHFDRLRVEGVPTADALRTVVRKLLVDSFGWHSDSTSKNRENLIRSVIWYIDEFSTDPLKTCILEDGKPAVELSFRMELDWGPEPARPYVLCGHLDRIVEFQNDRFLTDRKTTGATIGGDYFRRFDLDNQMSLYTIASQVIFHTPVKGVIIDGAQVAVGFTRFARGMTYRTPAQLNEWLDDLKIWLPQAEGYAKANYWPMNERSCFLCQFKTVCSQDPRVREKFLESDFTRRPWNPLETR